MKRSLFISLFIGTNIFFVFLQIHRHSLFIKVSYEKQRQEKIKTELAQKKQNLIHELYSLKDRGAIKKFAEAELGMHKVKLNQIKKLNDGNDQTA